MTFLECGAYNEKWHGIHQLKILKEITEDLTNDRLQSLADDMTRIGELLLKNNNMRAGLIGEEKDIKNAITYTNALKNNLGTGPNTGFTPPSIKFSPKLVRECHIYGCSLWPYRFGKRPRTVGKKLYDFPDPSIFEIDDPQEATDHGGKVPVE